MKKIILALLVLSLFVEFILSILGILFTELALTIFGVDTNNQTLFLAVIIGWLCLFVSMIIGLCIYYLIKNRFVVFDLLYCLGIFWILLGLHVYFQFNRIDNLFLDSVKGFTLIILTYFYQKKLNNEN